MPMENVIALISSLQLDSDNMNTWVSGVAKALKRYLPSGGSDADVSQTVEDNDE